MQRSIVRPPRLLGASGRPLNFTSKTSPLCQCGEAASVITETIADANSMLHINWFGGSFVDLPVRDSSIDAPVAK
jgi:hypothetical protein